MTESNSSRRFYRLRTPQDDSTWTESAPRTTAVSVRVDEETGQLYLAVGAGSRRMYVTETEAWTLWRCLSEALASLGEPPAHINTTLRPTRRTS